MKTTRWIAVALFATALAACGGGGGSPGKPVSGTGTGTGTSGGGGTSSASGSGGSTATPALAVSLVDASGQTIANNAISPSKVEYAQVVVTDASGAPVPNTLVAFQSASGLVVFQPASGQVLTDATGTAKVQVAAASISTTGAEKLTASTTVGTAPLSTAINVQMSPGSVALANLSVTTPSLTAFQSTSVSADVSINGQSAGSTPVSVSFTAGCGTFSPASVASNSNGKAITTYQPTGCTGGTVTLTASAVGASPAQTSVTVTPPTATNVLFISANPPTIYTAAAAFGVKQSTVAFKVVDASGNAITVPTSVLVSLSSSAIASGVVFADTNNTTPEVVSTDSSGQVSVIVRSGSVPTPLSVTASLVSNPLVSAASAGLSVDSGRPSQAFFSLSASKFNIEGWDYDYETTTLQVLLADRLGQPVPAGTPVSFVTQGGQVNASCSVAIDSNGKSGCTVTLISQAFRPVNGRVMVLAYAEGEEVFEDANGNNQYDPGETFYDMGQPFLDANETGVYVAGEQKIGNSSLPGAGFGTLPCPSHRYQVASINGTCDGVWGQTLVRQDIVIVFSGSYAAVPVFSFSGLTVNFNLADQNGNAMPNGTTISATVNGGSSCSLASPAIVPSVVPNAINPTFHSILLSASGTGATCSGATLRLTVTTPKGIQTLLGPVTVP